MNDDKLSSETPDCEDKAEKTTLREWAGPDDELAALAKALAHPARVQIVRFLLAQDQGTCICGDICEHVPLAQSTVSQHLKMLKKAGLIRGRVDGPRICYCVARESLNRLTQLLQDL
jgi:ArsR family transcriptional regulator